jgi:hypothetical protein
MERKVKWQVRFRTRSERLGVVSLYEEGYEGDIIELTGAAVPFETQEDSSDKWLEPIRKQTGYIRVLDEGNTEGIMPVGMKDRYVEYTEDGVLMWCGYMVPDVYSSDWDVTPMEVEFPVVGGLGVLEGEYMNEADGFGVVSLLKLMYQCLKATGIDYRNIYIPRDVLKDKDSADYLYPLTVEVSRYNFFKENDSLNMDEDGWTRYNGDTCYNVLAEMMRFWGWTIRERGNDLWITSPTAKGSVVYTFGELEDMVLGLPVIERERSVEASAIDIMNIGLAGADHKRDILQGRKKVVVNASVNPVGEVIPAVDKTKMKLVSSFVVDWGGSYYEKRKLYTPKPGYTDVQLMSYAKMTPTGVYTDWTPVEQDVSAISLYVGAYYIEQEKVSAADYAKKKNWNLTETIKINLQDFNALYPTIEEARNMPILIMKSRRIANYVSGAFVISAQTRSRMWEESAWEGEENGKGALELRFRVGEKYWNGSGWADSPSWFSVQMGNEDQPNTTTGVGKIISTKTLDMPYNGADGYVMPITEPIDGEVELMIHAVRNDGGYGVLFLDNLKVGYYGVDDEEQKSDDAENRYARDTGINYTNEEEMSLKMATNNNNKAGYGILSLGGANIETMYFVGYGKEERPEMNLVNKAVELYGRSTEKLTLQLDKVEATPQDLMLWNGKEYVMASEAVNWADESGQYIIMEV